MRRRAKRGRGVSQAALFDEPKPTPTGIVHIVAPDMMPLCRDDFLEATARGDRCAINPHVNGGGWRSITCPWCRSLGRAFYRRTVNRMQRADK